MILIVHAFNKESLKQVLDICKSQETVFLCFDSDDAGNRFQSNMSQMLFRHHVNFRCGALPEGVKDVSDYYQGR
jgi:DNA primase